MNPKRILIVKLSALGDVVHTWPAARSLRRTFPDAFIAWVVEAPFRDLVAMNPDIDEVIPLATRRWRKNPGLKSLGEARQAVARLRQLDFDTAIDFNGLIKSGVVTWLSGARERIGFHPADCRERPSAWFTNRHLPRQEPGRHVADLNLALASQAGAREAPGAPAEPHIPDASVKRIDAFLAAHPELRGRPLAALNPGAGFPSKLWDAEKFARLGDRLAGELGFKVLLLHGPGELELAKSIAGRMQEAGLVCPPTSIPDMAALCPHLALLVSCDSGPLHLAAALGVPTVSIFGPTDPRRNGAQGPAHHAVYKELSCSFCWKRTCPLGTGECMKLVDADLVFDTIKGDAARYRARPAPGSL